MGFALRFGLRVRATILILLVALPIIAYNVVAAFTLREQATAKLRDDAVQAARMVGATHRQIVHGARDFVMTLAHLPRLPGWRWEDCQAFLLGMREAGISYLGYAANDMKGDALCNSRGQPSTVNIGDRAYFERALRTRGFVIGDYQIGRVTGRPSIPFVYPSLNAAGEVETVWLAVVDVDWLAELTSALQLPPAWAMLLTDADGRVLTHFPHPERFVDQMMPDPEPFRAAFEQPEGVFESVGLDGSQRVYGFTTISEAGGGFVVSVSIPRDVAFAPANQQLLAGFLVLAAVSAVALAAAWLGAQRLLVNPLRAVLQASRELRAGNLEARTGVVPGAEEVGQLAHAFDEMADTLQQRERARAEAEARLRQAEKMEAIGHLTGGVAHDFNNLLTVIIGSLERATRRLDDHQRLTTLLGNALAAAERGAQLNRELLAFARRQPLRPEILDLNRLAGDMEELIRRTIGERYDVQTVRAAGLWPTVADRAQVQNALLNLVVNARDAMPDGGRLTIETANAHLGEAYAAQHDELAPGEYVMLAVSDTGGGMSPEVIARAFEPFFTTKEAGHGTGLGLSMVYGFVKQSNGHVRIYSEPGQGTTVKIYLPRAAHGAAASPRPPVAPAAAGNGETVLIVEDDPQVRAVTRGTLEDLGYRVLEAADGEQTLALLDAEPQIRLLFTDVVIPGALGGAELAAEACRRRPQLKVIFASGYTENAIIHHGRLDPGVTLLSKPFRQDELARKVRAVLDQPPAGEAEP